MAVRYYHAPIVGAGTRANPYRPKVQNYSRNYRMAETVVLDNGQPLRNWALVLVDEADHTALLTDIQLFPWPNISLDTVLSPAQQQLANAELLARGITPPLGSRLRDYLQAVGRFHFPGFDVNRFNGLRG